MSAISHEGIRGGYYPELTLVVSDEESIRLRPSRMGDFFGLVLVGIEPVPAVRSTDYQDPRLRFRGTEDEFFGTIYSSPTPTGTGEPTLIYVPAEHEIPSPSGQDPSTKSRAAAEAILHLMGREVVKISLPE